MQSRFLGVGILVLALSLLVTSFAKQSVVGTWKESIFGPRRLRPSSMIIEYRPDGTMTTWTQIGSETVVAAGHYTVKDNTITMTITNVSRNGSPVPLSSKMAKPQMETFKVDSDHLLLTPKDLLLVLMLIRIKPR